MKTLKTLVGIMNLHVGLGKFGPSKIALDIEQEHGIRNALQIVDSVCRVLQNNRSLEPRAYYQIRAEQFRKLAKNLEVVGSVKCLLVVAQAYERLSQDETLPLIR